MTDLFSLREQEIFLTLRALHDCSFVVIGGYAVNAYTLPRFSIDCDIVIKDQRELDRIEKILLKQNYQRIDHKATPYFGNFQRYEKKLEHGFAVSIDILIGKVTDRLTGAAFTAEWVFAHTHTRRLFGKTIREELPVPIIDLEALMVMKIISCRATDIRDVFMLSPKAENKPWIRAEVQARTNFQQRMQKIMDKVSSLQFKDGLSGVFGYVDETIFVKHQKAIQALSL